MDKPKILVTDDDAATREMVAFLLQEEGYEVLLAKNGLEAVQIAERETLDLILLDLMMPEMDGYEALNTFRESGRLSNVPILVISARSIPIYQEISKNLGALDHIVKPFLPDELLERIRTTLAARGKAPVAPQEPPSGAAGS